MFKKINFFHKCLCDPEYLSDDMHQFLQNPDAYFNKDNIIKNGDTSTVAKIQIDGHNLIVKRYNVKSFWHLINICWRKSRAIKSWHNAHRLQKLNIKTPNHIAILEKRFVLLHGKTYFITEFIQGTLLRHFFENDTGNQKEIVKNKMLELIQSLHSQRITHGDMKATNFILQDLQPIILDLDAMRFHHYNFFLKKRIKKDLTRFMKNWKGNPEIEKLWMT